MLSRTAAGRSLKASKPQPFFDIPMVQWSGSRSRFTCENERKTLSLHRHRGAAHLISILALNRALRKMTHGCQQLSTLLPSLKQRPLSLNNITTSARNLPLAQQHVHLPQQDTFLPLPSSTPPPEGLRLRHPPPRFHQLRVNSDLAFAPHIDRCSIGAINTETPIPSLQRSCPV